jgi:anaerobic ribonucleoside-triphosphate reductase
MTPLIPRGKIRWTNIYIKGEDQTDKYIYYTNEQHYSTKTKVLVFNRAGRHFKQKFLFNGNEIECVSQSKITSSA